MSVTLHPVTEVRAGNGQTNTTLSPAGGQRRPGQTVSPSAMSASRIWSTRPTGGGSALSLKRIDARTWGASARFREGDSAAVTAYALARSLHERSYTELLEDGLQVQGRSSADRGRQVKPAFQLWRDSGTALRHWVPELALSPDSRGRTGISEDGEPDESSNPFAGVGPFG